MADSVVYLVDDDEAVRLTIAEFLQLRGLNCKSFSTGHALLDELDPRARGCLVVDFKMPEMSGLQLIGEVAKRGVELPFLIISGYATITMAVEAMRLGAVNIIEKPFEPEAFLEAVRATLARGAKLQLEQTVHSQPDDPRLDDPRLDDPRALLTPREKQVLGLVVQGYLTKQIARQLQISCKTVEVHRSNITKKFRVNSVAQLIRRVLTIYPEYLIRQPSHLSKVPHSPNLTSLQRAGQSNCVVE